MAYATAAELRDRYRQGLEGVDEFAHREDADLEQALTAASSEIDSWRPQGAIGVAATAVLADKAMTLARMLIHQDDALDQEHPIVRDALEVRRWLRALAAGTVKLPTDSATTGPQTPVVSAPSEKFGAAFASRYAPAP